ncbi:hypothetical protein ACFX13_041500 [Malus domestica]
MTTVSHSLGTATTSTRALNFSRTRALNLSPTRVSRVTESPGTAKTIRLQGMGNLVITHITISRATAPAGMPSSMGSPITGAGRMSATIHFSRTREIQISGSEIHELREIVQPRKRLVQRVWSRVEGSDWR